MNGTRTAKRELSRASIPPLQQLAIESMKRSRTEALEVTIFAEARAESLTAAKAAYASGPRVTMTALLAKLLAGALAEHGALNASIDGAQIVRYAELDLGIAVALPDGNLTLPVLRGVDALALPEIAAQLDGLVERARHGKLARADVGGATFTLSNVGHALPGITGTPALPAGQCGVLLVTAPRPAPVIEDGKIVAGSVFSLSLTFDHRIVNGMTALAFLAAVRERIEAPAAWL